MIKDKQLGEWTRLWFPYDTEVHPSTVGTVKGHPPPTLTVRGTSYQNGVESELVHRNDPLKKTRVTITLLILKGRSPTRCRDLGWRP